MQEDCKRDRFSASEIESTEHWTPSAFTQTPIEGRGLAQAPDWSPPCPSIVRALQLSGT